MKALSIAGICALLTVIVLSSLGYRDVLFGWVHQLPGADRTGHVFFMGALAFLVVILLVNWLRTKFSSHFRSVVALIVGLLFVVALEEGSQAFLPTRAFDPADLYCGWVGIVLFGGLAGWLIRPRNSPD